MTTPGRIVHVGVTVALALVCFEMAPASWPRHVVLAAAIAALLVATVLGAMAAAALDIFRGRRR